MYTLQSQITEFKHYVYAAIAQLGERQTEDLKVPGSIPGGGSMLMVPVAQRTRRETTNLKIAGSNPVGDKLLFFHIL